MMRPSRMLAAALLAVCAAPGSIAAQPVGNFWDTSQLPETRGTVKQYTLTPRGEVDGLILSDGTEVKVPPHLSAQFVFAVRPGDGISIRGLKAQGLSVVEASSVTNLATGATVVDAGPPGGPDRTWINQQTFSGRIVMQLHGPRGDINGALFDNGTVLRLPPPDAERLQTLIQPGQPVTVRGAILRTPLGTVIEATAIGSSPDQLNDIAFGAPPRGPMSGPMGGPLAGPGGAAGFPPPRPPR